jgi:hypothetical protein
VKTYGGVAVLAPSSLVWATDGYQCLPARFGRFTPGKTVLDVRWIGSRVGEVPGFEPRASSLDVIAKPAPIAAKPIVKGSAFLRSVHRLLVTANVPISPTLVALMMEAINSSETSVLIRATRRKAILHSHRRENIKSYTALTGWPL